VLAELSYRFVERPFRKGGAAKPVGAGRPAVPRRPVVRRLVLATVAAVAVTGVGFQLTAAAARPVPRVPVDPGPAATLGALPTQQPSGRPSAGPSHSPGIPKVAVFGDSQGMTLLVNKPADLGKYITATDASIEGCGVLVGRVASRSGERRDLTASCGDWASRWAGAANKLRPRIALVMIGAWEVFDLTTGTGTLTFGSAQWDAHLSEALRQGIATLRASGATTSAPDTSTTSCAQPRPPHRRTCT
jgi:hypothetical protein